MKSLLKIAGVGTLALLTLVFVFRAQASANDGPSCAPTTGFVPQFCVNVPVGTSVRHETTVPLSTVLTTRADVRVESGIPAPEVVRLASSVDSATIRIEQVFGRSFTTKPRILVFATRASFARGAQDLFGYSPETAANVAASYGGVFDPQTLTIAVSWQSTAGSNLPRLLAHELTHLATRELVGTDAVLPAWFEEGLAAEIQAGDAGIDKDAQLAARSLLANAPRTLDTINTLADWHREYARLGTALYAVSAEIVGAMEAQIGRGTMFALLADVGHGVRFEDAYRARAGEDLAELLVRFSGGVAFQPTVTVGTVPDSSGNVRWTLTGFAPNSEVRITISGTSYDLGYSVRTDGIGMYRGTFGSTAAAGSYTLTANSASFSAMGTIDTASR
jgi:peptidase MA superfamily protein